MTDDPKVPPIASRARLEELLTKRYWDRLTRAVADATEYIVGCIDDNEVAHALEYEDELTLATMDADVHRFVEHQLRPQRVALDDDEGDPRRRCR